MSLVLADSTQINSSGLNFIQTTREYSESTQVVLFTPDFEGEKCGNSPLLETAYLIPKQGAVRDIGHIVQDILRCGG